MNRVKLESAFAWECTTCHHLNFETAERGQIDQEQAEMIDFRFGDAIDACLDAVPDWSEDSMAMSEVLITRVAVAPHMVTCRKCGEKFLTEIRHEEDDSEGGEE